MSCLQNLPNELLYLIASDVHEAVTLINLSLTCRALNLLVSDILRNKRFTYRVGPQDAFQGLPSSGGDTHVLSNRGDNHMLSNVGDNYEQVSSPSIIASTFLAICHSRKLASTIWHARLNLEPEVFMSRPSQDIFHPLGQKYADWDAIRKAIEWLEFPDSVARQLKEGLRQSEGDLTLITVLTLLLLPNLQVIEALNLDALLSALIVTCGSARRQIFPSLKTLFFEIERSKYQSIPRAATAKNATVVQFLRSPSLENVHILSSSIYPRKVPHAKATWLAKLACSVPTDQLCSSVTSLSILRLAGWMETNANSLQALLSNLTNLKTFRYVANGYTTVESFKALENSRHTLQTFDCVYQGPPFGMTDHYLDIRPYQALKYLRMPAACLVDADISAPPDLIHALSRKLEHLNFFVHSSYEFFIRRTFTALLALIKRMTQEPSLFPNFTQISLRSRHPQELEKNMGLLKEACLKAGVAISFGNEYLVKNYEAEGNNRCYDYPDWGTTYDD
ncbi:hypothetical protein MMC10_001587 [Thelotrema lepadinum]|nr:hypothetical protein [Thelotrema lepadinum]